MPASLAMTGYGATFELETAAGSLTYDTVAEVSDITPPSATFDVIDVSHSTSPNNTKEFITGMTDPGDTQFTMNFVPGSGSDLAIQNWRDSRERRSCRITFPNGVKWTFSALLTGYSPSVPTSDKMTAQVTAKVTGSTVVS